MTDPKAELARQLYLARNAFMDWVKAQLGKWYIWGGDDPGGFDCSGLVVEGLKCAGVLKEHEDLTANGLYKLFSKRVPLQQGFPGALAFWLTEAGHAYHVAVCMNELFCITANGGNRNVKTIEDAMRENAFITIRPLSHRKTKPVILDPFMP